MGKFSQFHPYLDALLTKLADPKYTTTDARQERLDWTMNGCPVAKAPVAKEPKCRICYDVGCACAGYTG